MLHNSKVDTEMLLLTAHRLESQDASAAISMPVAIAAAANSDLIAPLCSVLAKRRLIDTDFWLNKYSC